MTSIDELINKFEIKIKEGYEKNRQDKLLSEHSYQSDEPPRDLFMYDEPLRQEKSPDGGTITFIPPPKIRNVKPYQVGYKISLENSAINTPCMEDNMKIIGERVALREAWVIAKGMSDNTTKVIDTEEKGNLSKNDLLNACDLFSSQDYPDTIIVPSRQRWKLLRKEIVWGRSIMPTGYVQENDRGPYYMGNFNSLRVYDNPMVRDFALVYSKHEIIVKTTPFEFEFNESEQVLVVSKWCSSAPIRKEAVVKINL